MKTKYLVSIIAWFLLITFAVAAVYAGEQARKYISSQDKKQIYLSQVSENVAVLASCLQANYRADGVKPEFTLTPEDASKLASSQDAKK